EGYKFVGWKGQGADVIEWSADTTTFGVTGLCHYAEGSTEGYATLEAVFEKVEAPVVQKNAHVTFTVDPEKGSFVEYGNNPVKFDTEENNPQQFEIPAVKAKEGYKFVGWKGQGADVIEWGADAATFGVTGLCHYAEGETDGYASIEAVFEKVEVPAEKRTANVYFNVDPEKGSFTEYGEGPVTFLNLDEFDGQQYQVPEVTAKEGYKFVGWKGQGADVIEWGADAATFGVTGLCHYAEGETDGYASIEAVFEKVEVPAEKRTANVYFNVDPEKGSFTEYGEGPVTFLNLDEFDGQQYQVPEVTAKEGYKFVGWKGQGADVIEWSADTTTFGVTGLCHYAEGSTEGYATLEAVFEKVEAPVTEKAMSTLYIHFMDGEQQVGVSKFACEGIKGNKVVFKDYKVVAPIGYKLATNELPVVEGVFGEDYTVNIPVVKVDAAGGNQSDNSQTNNGNQAHKEESKKDDKKVSTSVATGVFGSLAGLTAAGAGIVALLRRRNSK
ncbi:MAG: InlB B-repeat-containing protein, partial [Porphyromonadaceae bacterium]|nr:InlB B-repeat-containing protein [Porphyromonadaceae bacterium]